MRLIDADALMESLCDELGEDEVLYRIPPDAIDEAPTIEAAPVVHGRWVCVSIFLSPVSGRGQHKCSNCEDYYTTDAKHMYFCPNCGAKMVEIEHPAQYGPKYDFVDGEWKTVHGLISESFVETRTEADFPNCGARMDGDGDA